MIPTVRVKHPSGDGFMTINASDFDAERHELWSEQAEGFDAAVIRRPVASLDPAVRDAAAALCVRMVALRRRAGGESFADLPPPEQLAVLNSITEEFARAEAEFDEGQRERDAFEGGEQTRQMQDDPWGRPDGYTLVNVIASDGGDFEVLRSPDDTHELRRNGEVLQRDTMLMTAVSIAEQMRDHERAGQQAAADATARAQSAPPAPVPESLRVGKGPRGLWFVFRGEERVSRGYSEQSQAEAEAQRLIQAEHAAAQDAAQ